MKAEVPEYAVHDEVCVDLATTAVLVINMQNDFVKEGGNLLVPDAEATIPPIKRLLDLARGNRMRIVYCQDTHHQGDAEWRTWPEHCREGSWGWEIISELAPAAGDAVVPKLRHDAFYGTSLDELLRGWGITTLVLCGTVANICVQYTASSAVLRSYAVVIPRDALSALVAFDLEASLRQTTFVFAGRLTTVAGIRVVETATVESPA